jgi:SNF2 family DNA or RNA helicase
MDMCEAAFRSAGISCVRVDGATGATERVAAMQQFQSGAVQIFLGSLLAVQTGITLTSARRIVILEPGWTGDSNVQVVKRIHRLSQTQPCRAQLLVAANTLEEAVMKQVEAEITMAHTVVDGGVRSDRDEHSEW